MTNENLSYWEGFYPSIDGNFFDVGVIDPYMETDVEKISNSNGCGGTLILRTTSSLYKSIEFVSRFTPAGYLAKSQAIILTDFDGYERMISFSIRKQRKILDLEFQPWKSVFGDGEDNLVSLVLDFEDILLSNLSRLQG